MVSRYGPRYPWLKVAPVLRRADIAVANLESAVSNRGYAWPGKYTFRGPPKALRATAKFAGVDVVSLANNHSLDYGRVAFAGHAALHPRLRAHEDRRWAEPRTRPAARRPRGRRAQRRVPRLLGRATARVRRRARPFRHDPGFPPHLIEADVRRAARRHDLVVVYFHWGIERDGTQARASAARRPGAPSRSGRRARRIRMSSSRGSGEGAPAGGLVAWSLGNFVFTGTSAWTRTTGILNVRLGRVGVLGTSWRRAFIVNSQPQLR